MFVFDFLKIEISYSIWRVGLYVIAFLWGLSGFLMVVRKEFIDKRGRRYFGGWAIFNGIILLLMGWGSLIFFLLTIINNW